MLYCVRLCVRFLFLRKIFARKEERMGIKGRTDWEEWKSGLGGMEELIGRKGRTDREEWKNGSGEGGEYQRWYSKVPAVVHESTTYGIFPGTSTYSGEDSIVCQRRLHRPPENTTSSAGEHYIVCRRTLHRLPENTTSSTGEHLFDSPHPTLIGFIPFSTRRTGNRAKILRKNRNLTQNLTHQNSLSINE